MKLRHLLFGLLAGVAFVACTNDDDPAGASPVNGGDKVEAAPMYMAVDLQLPSSGAATRAIDGTGFEKATPAENDVKEAAFLFFNADGTTQVADPLVIKAGVEYALGDGTTYTWNPGEGTVVQKPQSNKKTAVLIVKNPTAIPTSLVVLVNSGKTEADLADATVASLQGEDFIADYSATTNGFVMSNSVYVAGGKVVVGAPIGSENIKKDATEALTDPAPVKVYVERVVAKVGVTKDSNISIESGVPTIDVEITGFGLVNENANSYLIKNLQTSYNYLSAWTGWNDPTNFRSYWADAATFTAGDGTAYNQYVTLESVEGETKTPNYLYTQENTAFYNAYDNKQGTPTIVVVAATLKYTDPTVEGAQPAAVDLYRFRGKVYTEKAFKTLMADNATVKQYFKKTSAEGETPIVLDNFDADDFGLNIVTAYGENAPAIKNYEVKANLVLKDNTVVYDANGNDVTATAKPVIEGIVETAQFFKQGATYYYVPIVQNSALNVNVKTPAVEDEGDTPATPATYWGLFGVVRNHFYQLNIKKINGLGTAVPDPTQVIIPETPEEEVYNIAAELRILDWKKVTQDVELGY